MEGKIGHLSFEKTSFEWKIEKFFDKTFRYTCSPTFVVSDAFFYIQMKIVHEYGKTLQTDNRMVSMHLCKVPSESEIRVECTISLKESGEGSVFKSLYFNHLFPADGRTFIKSQSLEVQKFSLQNGTLTVLCEARVAEDSSAVARTSVPNNIETLSRHYENIYTNGCDTDVVIEVKGRKFSAHRLILSARSSVFRSMFELDMKERGTGSVNITDCDPESFGAFLQFLYSGKSDAVTSDNVWDLYATAEKYDVQDLKEVCGECMSQFLCVESVCDVILFADLHGNQELLTRATIYFIKNASVILKTSKWQRFVRENFTLASDLYIKLAEDSKNNRKINKEIMKTAPTFSYTF